MIAFCLTSSGRRRRLRCAPLLRVFISISKIHVDLLYDDAVSEKKNMPACGVKSREFEQRRPGNWPLSVGACSTLECDRCHSNVIVVYSCVIISISTTRNRRCIHGETKIVC